MPMNRRQFLKSAAATAVAAPVIVEQLKKQSADVADQIEYDEGLRNAHPVYVFSGGNGEWWSEEILREYKNRIDLNRLMV